MKLEHKSLIFKVGDTVGNIAKALIIPHLFAVNRSQTTTAKSTEKKTKQNKRNQTCSNHRQTQRTDFKTALSVLFVLPQAEGQIHSLLYIL